MNPIIATVALFIIFGSLAFSTTQIELWSGIGGAVLIFMVARVLRGPDREILQEVREYEENGGVTIIQYYDGAEKAHFVRGPVVSRQARNWVQTLLEKTDPNVRNGEEYEYTEIFVKDNQVTKVVDHYVDWPGYEKKMRGHSGAHGQELFRTFVDQFNGPDRKTRKRGFFGR